MNMKSLFGKAPEGSTESLLQLAFGYFSLYILTGFFAKYFDKVLGVGGTPYAVYNTIGGTLLCLIVVIALKWYKFKSSNYTTLFGLTFPKEFLYIIPSGVCTAIVIPTTTLMYTLPISVMVAMIIMRASVIIISRLIDEIQIRQGILKKTVYWEENLGVVIALSAVALQLLNFNGLVETGKISQLFAFDKNDFAFLTNAAAMSILGVYLTAYSIRIYIMNYYKNTRPKGAIYDTHGFFAIEQIASVTTLLLAVLIFFFVVNHDAKVPYQPVEKPVAAVIAEPSAERITLTQEIANWEKLLTEHASKFTDEQRKATEQAIVDGSNLLADQKASNDDIKALVDSINGKGNPVYNVKKTFGFQVGDAIKNPPQKWFATIMSGVPYGIAAFFSVFLFMFKGRTATFAGLVNRLTSLIAGTVATLLVWLLIANQKPPMLKDWLGLLLMFVAIYFMGLAERKRSQELIKNKEIEAVAK